MRAAILLLVLSVLVVWIMLCIKYGEKTQKSVRKIFRKIFF
nr:MAG TPA: hypothetical protein [Caudoviricetes sp.]